MMGQTHGVTHIECSESFLAYFKCTHTLFVIFTEETLIVQIPTISQCSQGQNKCWAERENFPKKTRKKPLSSLKMGERGNIEAYRIIPIPLSVVVPGGHN